MSKRDLRDILILDEAIERTDGFVSHLNDNDIRYDIKKIKHCCRQKGIEQADLTIRGFNSFTDKMQK